MLANIEDYLKSHVGATGSSGETEHVSLPISIELDTGTHALVAEGGEIAMAVEKRFKGKRTAYGEPSYRDIIAWCIASSSYEVSSKYLESVSDKDVEAAWEFLDTASVSSTPKTREALRKFKKTRSAAGFRKEHRVGALPSITNGRMNSYHRRSKRLVCDAAGGSKHALDSAVGHIAHTYPAAVGDEGTRCGRNMVPPVLETSLSGHREGLDSIGDVLAEECIQWVIQSKDPCLLATRFRSSLLEFD